ncbi:MAG: type IX secretion system membrane protein PorP/SprF [Cyclobacteriaceae bacterium]|nr:type IX secretion system membrane protein PorP/SprF [Cyclobacteriaceae bacterium]
MRYITFVGFLGLFSLGSVALAQQQVMYSQYMFNTLAINPAYAGSHEDLSVTALMREQWVGLDGAPSTQTISAHLPFEKKRIGVGLMAIHDQIGVSDQTDVYASYAYKIPLQHGSLALGLQGGFSYYKAMFSEVSSTDPTFQGVDIRQFLPNFGAGIYYSTRRFYAGLSIPQMIQSRLDDGNVVSKSKIIRHYFVHSGYVFDLSPSLKLKPNVLMKVVDGAPIEFDLNANLYLHDMVGLGLSWRSMDAVVLMLQVQITDRLQFGYAYDFGTTALRQTHAGSHELFLNYRFALSKSRIITPRYF